MGKTHAKTTTSVLTERILEKWDGNMWSGFIWLRKWINGRLL
jgi:hypothetical protein